MFPRIQNERQRYDDPQGVHKHKVEPEVDWMSQLAVGVAISVLCEEVEYRSICLAWVRLREKTK